jgi:glycosyltransferase involved in cell wall biosynthesis
MFSSVVVSIIVENLATSMKTILHVIDTTGPGGAEAVFIQLADRIRQHGYRSVVLVRGPGWVHDELLRRGLVPLIVESKGSLNWQFLRALIRLIHAEKIDIIQSHLLGSNVYCALAGLLTRRPVIATFHGMVDIDPNERFRWLKLWLMNRGVKRFVTVSKSLLDDIRAKRLLNADKSAVIYNGIDLDRYGKTASTTLRKRLGLADSAILIGSLGNVRPAKGYDVLLRAARTVIERYPAAHFVIAGEPKKSLMAELDALTMALGIREHVHFIGYYDNSAEFLAQLDVFVLASLSEGFSISTIEAMATGLPVLVTRCGGPEEIATADVDALMVAPGNPAALAEGVIRLLSDSALCLRIATAGVKRVHQTFGIGKMVEGYRQLYESAN